MVLRKKQIIFILLFLVLIILLLLIWWGFAAFNNRTVGGGIAVTGSMVDNSYNNFKVSTTYWEENDSCSTSLFRDDDAIYYYCARKNIKPTLYKIDATQSQILYSHCPFFPMEPMFPLYFTNNVLYRCNEQYDFRKNRFLKNNDLLNNHDIEKIEEGSVFSYIYSPVAEQEYEETTLNLLRLSSLRKKDLYQNNDLLLSEYEYIYIEPTHIYYTKTNDVTETCTLYSYHRETKKHSTVYSYKLVEKDNTLDYIVQIITTKQKIIFIKNNGCTMYMLDKGDYSLKEITVGADGKIGSINTFLNKIYACLENTEGATIWVYNELGEKEVDFGTNPAEKCYIIDDKWVYYTSYRDLYRMTKDGSLEELVFKCQDNHTQGD